MKTVNGMVWHFCEGIYTAGEFAPVHAYTVSRTDLTPVSPGDPRHSHTWCGTAKVSGYDEFPAPGYYRGIRREMRVEGPVMNMDQTGERVVVFAPTTLVQARNAEQAKYLTPEKDALEAILRAGKLGWRAVSQGDNTHHRYTLILGAGIDCGTELVRKVLAAEEVSA